MLETRVHVDEGQKTVTFQRAQDVSDIIDLNKQLQTIDQKSDWGRHVARIPNIFLEKWLHEEYERGNVTLQMYSEEFDKLVQRKLSNPDWAFLRVDKKACQLGYMGS